MRKSRVVKAIKMSFTLLGKRKELVISTFTRFAANSIGGSIVHIVLGVNNWAKKIYQVKINSQWLYYSLIIIHKVNIIDLKLLTLIDKQLQKAERINSNLTTVFGRLFLVILMENYYQFASVLEKNLWKHLASQKKVHKKSFWSRFIIILILIDQMC